MVRDDLGIDDCMTATGGYTFVDEKVLVHRK